MGLQGLLDAVATDAIYEEFMRAAGLSKMPTAVLPNSSKPWLLAALHESLKSPLVVVTSGPERARALESELKVILGDQAPVHVLPERDALPYERLVADHATAGQRLLTLSVLAHSERTVFPPLIITSVVGASQCTLSYSIFMGNSQSIRVGDTVSLEEILSDWLRLGYSMEPVVEVPGTFSRRGGILDIYPPADMLPSRIEFWGNQIESIRHFDPINQRSIGNVDHVMVNPAAEVLPSLSDSKDVQNLIGQMDLASCSQVEADRIEEELSMLMKGFQLDDASFYAGFFCSDTVFDYLPDNAFVVLDEPNQLKELSLQHQRRIHQLRQAKQDRGELPVSFPTSDQIWSEMILNLPEDQLILNLSQWHSEDAYSYDFHFKEAPSFQGNFDLLVAEMRKYLSQGTIPIVVTYHDQRLMEILTAGNIPQKRVDNLEHFPDSSCVTIIHDHLAQGWTSTYNSQSIVVLTDREILGVSKMRPSLIRSKPRPSFSLEEMTLGSYVVHVDHGVAKFTGTVWRSESDGTHREFLVLEYAEKDRLYVPTNHLDRVAPYVAPGDRLPTLTRLGTQEWNRIKQRVRQSTREMAEELLQLYSRREFLQGTAFPGDTPWEREMEDSFPYVETPDQIIAINQVKQDMQRARPMDRLVCGDVGYGKTEVALRAAFKAVMSGMQVAVLVPTTVLAQQHYETLVERMRPYPVKVEVLSRFRTRTEQDEVIQGLKEGSVDVCIGTHRLLQKDVGFKNLGLVVVDEEQRFGVRHKEKMKQMRQEVDVLTLTATPIPRTLHMALSGVRDMSTMDTPPEERLPVKTYASEQSDDLVREAVLRELDRGGQVFVVHNRVKNIGSIATWVQGLVPEARLGIGHGQMPEDQLATVMKEFSRGQLDILVCTTIIESGLDLGNANTMIINRADLLGLGQLYQLRGRVGRGGQRAYCYLLVPKGIQLTETADRRIKTILAATELGSGFRIAMMDLEIRGAGNLLGAEQSGYIHAVGFDLYNRLLKEVVEELNSQQNGDEPKLPIDDVTQDTHTRVDLPLAAHIPENYISNLAMRLSLYRRLMDVSEQENISQISEELKDRFGPFPTEVTNLLFLLKLRVLADQIGVESITIDGGYIVVRLHQSVGGARLALEKDLGGLAEVGNTQMRVRWNSDDTAWEDRLLSVLERLDRFKERVEGLDDLLESIK